MISADDFYQKTKIFFKEISRSEIILQAILVGIVSGILVVLFKQSITYVFNQVQDFINSVPSEGKYWIFPLITTIGGLIAGILVFKFAPETKGSGIPYVKLTLARIGKGTRLRSILVKFFAGVAGIGTGLSLGREGPSVQLGAGAGALIARIFKMKGTNQDKLIAAGAGAAIGATFNAPIAGALFVIEELVQKFSSSLLFPVLIATVSAAGIARYFCGDNPSFIIPKLTDVIYLSDILVFIVLGLFAAIFGVLFSKIIFLNLRIFDNLKRVPDWIKPGIAGLIVGIAGLFLPYILGSGNLSVDMLLAGKISFALIVVIFFAKLFITPLCFGSGAAGGIFLPTLMLGSFLGYIIGLCANYLGSEINPVVVALVGMGAFLSAVARTPITAAVMVFEMTGDYNHILPIMLAVAVADLTAEKMNHLPIYTSLIFRQANKSHGASILSSIPVKDIMTKEVYSVYSDENLHDLIDELEKNYHFMYPVLSSKNSKIAGVITQKDIADAKLQDNYTELTAEKIMNPSPVTVKVDADLYMAYGLMHFADNDSIMVIDKNKCLKGVITREDIKKCLIKNQEIL